MPFKQVLRTKKKIDLTFIEVMPMEETDISRKYQFTSLTDIFDRLTTGTNQRWAFVNITSPIIEDRNAHPFAVHSIEETDQLISDFISNIFILIHNEDQLGADWTQSRS